MKTKRTLVALLAAALLCATAARATTIRTGSSYGMISSSTSSSLGTDYLVPLTPISPSDFDLLLQISPTSPDLGDPLQVTLDLGSSFISGDDPFGILACNNNGMAGTNLGAVCTPTSNPACDLTGVTDVAGSIVLPGSCDVANETFYFDLASTSGIAVSPVTATLTPEPGSLSLLGLALFSLVIFSRRRVRA
jgi:hypothetical protein